MTTFTTIRKYNDYDRKVANDVRFANILAREPRPTILDRIPGYIIHFVNNKFTVVDLQPEGYCNQHRAIFQNGIEIVSGMDGIHAKIREIMPPLMSWRNF